MMNKIFRLGYYFLLLTAALSTAGFGQIILKNGNYLDISAKKTIPFTRIVIDGGIISRIETGKSQTSSANKEDESSYSVIDLNGQYLIPGLIDSFSPSLPIEPGYLSRSGVTTSVVLGGNNPGMGKISRSYIYFHFPTISPKKETGDIFYSGPLITSKNFLNTEPGSVLLKKIRENLSTTAIENNDDLEDLFREWDKTPPSLVFADFTELKKISPELVSSLLAETRQRGLKVVGYAETGENALTAAEGGADLVAMNLGTDLGEDWLKLAELGIPLITSVTIYKGYGRDLRREEEGEAREQQARLNLKKFLAAGGKVLIGSSYGSPWVEAGPPFEEIDAFMAVYRELGRSSADLMTTITSAPVEAFGLNRSSSVKKGRIEAGYAADLVVTRENPLKNIDSLREIQMVINNGNLIRDERNQDIHAEIDLSYSQFFTRQELLIGRFTPPIDNYPKTVHITLAPLFYAAQMENGLGSFEAGLFFRFLIPSAWEYHQLKVGVSAVFHDSTLFHLNADYLHFFTPRWGLGLNTSILPSSHYIAGPHIVYQRIRYSSPGSRQWYAFEAFFNFEDYRVENSSLTVLKTEHRFDFYDFLPPLFSMLDFQLQWDGGRDWENQRSYLQEAFVFNFGISVWKNRFWQEQLWGEPLDRFRLQDSDGQLRSINIVGKIRSYDELDFQNTMIGWLTEIEADIYRLSFLTLKGGVFWEMQKRSRLFSELFEWGDGWVMDFGLRTFFGIGDFGIELGMYLPVSPRGAVSLPGFYGGLKVF